MTHTISRTDLRHLAGLFSLQEVADSLGIPYRQFYYRIYETKQLPRPKTQIEPSPRLYYTAIELQTLKKQVITE